MGKSLKIISHKRNQVQKNIISVILFIYRTKTRKRVTMKLEVGGDIYLCEMRGFCLLIGTFCILIGAVAKLCSVAQWCPTLCDPWTVAQ